MEFRVILAVAVTLLSFSTAAIAADTPVDSDRMTECFGAYDAMVALGNSKKFTDIDVEKYSALRLKAQAKAIELYKSEGLNEEIALDQLAGRATYMTSELRDLNAAGGIFSADDMRKLSAACDTLFAD
jgi:hypothetical protein